MMMTLKKLLVILGRAGCLHISAHGDGEDTMCPVLSLSKLSFEKWPLSEPESNKAQ